MEICEHPLPGPAPSSQLEVDAFRSGTRPHRHIENVSASRAQRSLQCQRSERKSKFDHVPARSNVMASPTRKKACLPSGQAQLKLRHAAECQAGTRPSLSLCLTDRTLERLSRLAAHRDLESVLRQQHFHALMDRAGFEDDPQVEHLVEDGDLLRR